MATWLKQSTAATVKIGPFLDSADGVTAETALTISQADVRLSKNGGNMAQKNESTSATHDEIGWYDCPLDATDTNTLGILTLMVAESGALPIWHEYMVVAANVYDSLIGGGDTLQVETTSLAANAITATAINADAFTAAKFAADVTTELQNGLATAAALATVDGIVDSILEDTGTTLPAQIDAIDNFLDTEIAAILADTNELQTDWVDGGRLDLILDAILVDTGTTLQAELDGIQADTEDIQTRLPEALVGGNMKADGLAINGSTAAAVRLALSAASIVVGEAAAGTLSTTQMTTNLTEATDDHYNGRIIIWTSGVLIDQAAEITDYTGSTKMLTYSTVTEAPSAGDDFVIV